MAAREEVDVPNFESTLHLVDALQEKLDEVKASVQKSDTRVELSVLWRRVKSSASALTYLKSKARIVAVPHLAHAYCGISVLDGVGIVDKEGIPLSRWSSHVDIPSFDSKDDDETWMELANHEGHIDEQDIVYTRELLNSVHMVADVLESLVKRAVMAESEAAAEKERAAMGQEENRKKVVQIESLSAKLEEMEQFALGTNNILNEMRQRVDGLVEETSRQRQRAAENEMELSRVKQDFENLKSYVSTLISVRETLVSSEKQFHTIEKHFERLIEKTSQLENEKMQKEAEVQKLMEENVRLSSQLDDKEAQLVAMSEQCKVMALSASYD